MKPKTLRNVLAVAVTSLGTMLIVSSATATGHTAPAKVKCPIVIGQAIALTGFAAPYDQPSAEAVKIKVNEINRSGGLLGCKLKIVTSDFKSQQSLSATAALDVIGKGASLVITTADYDFGGPAARAACQHGRVAFAPSASSPNYGAQGIGWCAFTLGAIAPSAGAGMAEWAFGKKHLMTAYVLTDTLLAATKQFAQAFEDRFTQLGGKVVGKDTFSNGDQSISAQITRLKSLPTPPDVLVLSSFPPGGATALRQIRAAGLSMPIVGGDGFDGTYWYKVVPDLSNMYFVSYASIFGDDPSPTVRAFFKKLQAATGQPPQLSFSITGYSVIEAFVRAAKLARSVDGRAIARQLVKFRNVPLLVGPTTLTPKYHFSVYRPLKIMQIQNGKGSYVGTITPKKVSVTFGG